MSKVVDVLNRIPQDNVFRSLLFICFLNDMPDVVHFHIQMFADDTKMYCEVNNEQQTELWQQYLTALENWTEI